MIDVKIKRAGENTVQDVFDALAELEKLAIGAGEGWSAESFRSEAGKNNGFVLYIQSGDRTAALLTGYYAAGEGDITNIAVHPDFRRKGLAQALIVEFEKLLPDDAHEIFLEVRESNEPAENLYKKCGFEQISLRKNFYVNPRENAIVMKKGEV